jgi:serine/threonine protein kinase
MEMEFKIQLSLNHPNIVKAYGYYPPTEITPAILILELVQGGDLFLYVKQKRLSCSVVRFIFFQVTTCV